jgi:hypothetical protein
MKYFNSGPWIIQQGFFKNNEYQAETETIYELKKLFTSNYSAPYNESVRQEPFNITEMLASR